MRRPLLPSFVLLISFTTAALVAAAENAIVALTPRDDSACGVLGYDKSNPRAFYYRNDTESANFSGCQAVCASQGRCVSFAISNEACLLYAASIQDDVRLDNGSPFKFYTVDCPDPDSSANAKAANVVTTAVNASPSSVALENSSATVISDTFSSVITSIADSSVGTGSTGASSSIAPLQTSSAVVTTTLATTSSATTSSTTISGAALSITSTPASSGSIATVAKVLAPLALLLHIL